MTFFRSSLAVATVSLVVAGCGGGGSSSPSGGGGGGGGGPMPEPVDLGMVTSGYDTPDAGQSVTIAAGGRFLFGDIDFHCAADGPACMLEVTVANDGAVSATSEGGAVTAENSEAYAMRLAQEERMRQAKRTGIAMALMRGADGPAGMADLRYGEDGKVMAVGLKTMDDQAVVDEDAAFTMSQAAPAMIAGWTGATYTRVNEDESVRDTVVVYANETMGDVEAGYVAFGYWLESTMDASGGMTYAFKPLRTSRAVTRPSDFHRTVDGLEGRATYSGPATGIYARKTFSERGEATVVETDQFTADAMLTADFSMTDHMFKVKGTVKDFLDGHGDMIDPAWLLRLDGMFKEYGSEHPLSGMHRSTFSGAAMGGGVAGKFNGRVLGTGEPHPQAAFLIFDGHFVNGHVGGAAGLFLVPLHMAGG